MDILLDFDLNGIDYEAPVERISLHSVLSDHAVLQQKKPIRIFGNATPESIVLAKLVNNTDQSISYQNYVIVDSQGDFVLELSAISASFDSYTLIVSDTVHEQKINDLLIGEVWIAAGQSNMGLKVSEMESGQTTMDSADNQRIRIFYQAEGDHNGMYPYQPAEDVIDGVWKTADSGANIAMCSGVGYSFARELFRLLQEERLNVPIAIINVAKGGSNMHSWLPREAMISSDPIEANVLSRGWSFSQTGWNQKGWENYNQPSALFNQKIAPLFQFQIGGVLWYQGESDAFYNPSIYSIPLLIDTWSQGFNQNDELLPFVMIQLHPYDGTDPLQGVPTQNYANLAYPNHRQAQFDVARMVRYSSTTVLVPIYDISLKWDVPETQFLWTDPIHPTTKIPVGERAGKAAYTQFFYGAVDFLAPMVESFEYDATTITITFAHTARGLKTFKNSELGVTTVEIFRTNGTRLTVSCVILDNTRIRIEGIDTTQVAYFSYGFLTRNEASNLSSSYGIPAIPFKIKLE